MTEEEWLTTSDTEAMLEYLRHRRGNRIVSWFFQTVGKSQGSISARKQTLLHEAIKDAFEAQWRRFLDMRVDKSISMLVDADKFKQLENRAIHVQMQMTEEQIRRVLLDDLDPNDAVGRSFVKTFFGNPHGPVMVRDIVGNPFRPVAFDPRWRSESAVALATGIYAERAFDRMPILADALEEAGCDNADVLHHCRDPQQVHARGCWVVDLVLGKS